ncbi:glycosyltransferase family protein [Vineibacter terrae]|uniref:glycosyltransferase family protein n=1 Tax=Vineibacter terrae TaxID=2586908 RepID=UPI002E3111FF|nr:glycosyltransferase [Vineibacter terrae]HEX2885796.1 glycosyltransferase [Vineibacter terrae]
MSARILFHVQHLLGIGHLRRAATLVRHLAAAGHDVILTSGGLPVPGLDLGGARLVQLPPVRATDKRFKILVDSHDVVIDDAFKSRRVALLLDTLRQHRPDLLITELFPFGRRQLRFELVPLVEAARALPRRPLVVSSVRDILVRSPKPERVDEMIDLFGRYFDYTLVHGDPAFIPFARTFPRWRDIADRTFHTGYVIDGLPADDASTQDGRGEVLVSAGGGAVGAPLLQAALAARPLSRMRDAPWRFLCGPAMPAADVAALRAQAQPAGAGVAIEPARRDFTTLLRNCALSISQGGYNTMIETLSVADRAVIVPYAGGLETEQELRAELLAERGVFQVVPEADLSPRTLATSIDRALDGPSIRTFPRIDAGGIAKTVSLIEQWLTARERKTA